MENIYIIGDVHGCYETLLALIEQFPNKQNSKICFVGDLVDRGANSKDVIELVRSNNYDCVLGNHEYLMIESYPFINVDTQNELLQRWIHKGGALSTIHNYKDKAEMFEDVEYLKTLPLYIEYKNHKTEDGRYLVVSHSALGKAWELRNSTNEEDKKTFETQLLWSRYRHCDNSEIFNVYGHTIQDEVYINEYNANIDLGCYNVGKISNSRICALEFPGLKIYTQENIEK